MTTTATDLNAIHVLATLKREGGIKCGSREEGTPAGSMIGCLIAAGYLDYAGNDWWHLTGKGEVTIVEYDVPSEWLIRLCAFVDAVGAHEADQYENYLTIGPWNEAEDYAWAYLAGQIGDYDVTGALQRNGWPADLARCVKFDPAQFVRDMQSGGVSFGRHNGQVYAFEPRN